MKKLTVFGLPLTPYRLMEQVEGRSFCVSFATRRTLGKQLDEAIERVGQDGLLLVDNGAWSHFQGGGAMTVEYQDAFEAWAADILERCPQAVAVIPDVIGGSQDTNAEMVREWLGRDLPSDRLMPVWHMNESIGYLLWLCEAFEYVAFGSTPDFGFVGSDAWHARMREAFAAIDAWEAESEGAYLRPRIHMMRAQAQAHLYPLDSSDSSNLAVNHCRTKHMPRHIEVMAARLDAKIQSSAGPEARHQIERPLLGHVERREAEFTRALCAFGDLVQRRLAEGISPKESFA